VSDTSSSRAGPVRLRPRTEADTEVLYQVAADLDTWEERGPSSPTTLTQSAYRSRLAEADSDATVRFVVDVGGVPVGSISLSGFDQLARHAEVGVALATDARGQGIGTAAIVQLIEFAFVRCNLRRLHLEVIESNRGAIRAYQKAGFVIEGRQREHAWVRGRYEDILRMGLLRSDWENSRSADD
jgi:RimJ/RimL family protein N-acetyltransferase